MANAIGAPVPRANFLVRGIDQLSRLKARVLAATRHLFYDTIPRLIVNHPFASLYLGYAVAVCFPDYSLVNCMISGAVFGYVFMIDKNRQFFR